MAGFDAQEIQTVAAWLIYTLGVAFCAGLAPSLMRGGARKGDPSIASALFLTFAAACGYALLVYGGNRSGLAALTGTAWGKVAVCGLIVWFTVLSLMTSLTGGLVNKVFPMLNASSVALFFASWFFLKTPLSLWSLCGVLLMLLGTVLILSRSSAVFGQLWFAYALLALAGCCVLGVLRMTWVKDIPADVFCTGVCGVAGVLMWIFVFLRGKHRVMGRMTAWNWILPPLAAVCLGAGRLVMLLRDKLTDPGIFDPTQVVAFVLLFLLARIVQKEKLPGTAFFGMLITVGGMVVMTLGL